MKKDRWIAVWGRLTEAERREAARLHLEIVEKVPSVRLTAIRFIAQHCRTRPQNVERWSLDRRSERLARVAVLPPMHIAEFVTTFFLRRHQPLLVRFLDAVGAPHLNGAMDSRTMSETYTVDALAKGIGALDRGDFPERDVELYLDALEAQDVPAFVHISEARRQAAVARAVAQSAAAHTGPAGAPVESPPEALPAVVLDRGPSSEEVPGGADHIVMDIERLSALDELVKRAAIATAAGIEGALDRRRLRRVVDELLSLNVDRHRSFYHLGFLDVLDDRALTAEFPHASDRHRGWYLVGAVDALHREGDHAGIVTVFDRHGGDVRRVLGARHEGSDVGALPLVDALLREGRRADAVDALVATTVNRAGAPLMERLLDEALVCLRELKSAEAMPILKLVSDGIDLRRRRKLDVDDGLVARVRLRHALALRLQGAFDLAKTAYEALLESPDAEIVAAGELGLGLTSCRVRSLTDVRLPNRAADLAATAKRLAPGRAWFERAALAEGAARLPADLCLATLHLAEGETEEARVLLERVVAAPASGGDALDEGHAALPRARLYFGVALAEALNRARAAEAKEHLVAGTRAWPEEAHPYLLQRALVALAATRPSLAAEATDALHELLGDALLNAALEAGMLPTHEPLRETLARRAEDERQRRRARSRDAEALLADALRAGDVGRAERALAVLEDLTDDGEGRQRLLEILEDRDRYDPAWGAEEALFARVRLLEAEGRYPAAAALLCQAGHELLSREPERGLFVARDLLDRIRGYGVEISDTSLTARVEALAAAAAPVAVAAESAGRIYFVGGNEVQARYEAWLIEEGRRRWPKVEIVFDFTGWSSNWGRNLPVIERNVMTSDAVVLMRFVRTMLGRATRALCSKHGRPWVACTGHGRDSLLRAIEEAVLVVQQVAGAGGEEA